MNQNKIDDITKSRVSSYLGNERKATTDNQAAAIRNSKLLQANSIASPMKSKIEAYNARTANAVTRDAIAILQNSNQLGRVITGKDIDEAGWQAVRELDAIHYGETKEAQAPHADRVKAYSDAADAKFQEAMKVMDTLEPKARPEGATATKDIDTAFNKAVSETEQGQLTFDEAQLLSDLPSKEFQTPQQERRVKVAATVATIQNSPDITIEAAVRQVIVDMAKTGDKFDPNKPAHLTELQSLLERAFAKTDFKPNVAKGVSLSHTPDAGKKLGQFLREEFDPRTVEHLIHPDQLGDIEKLREMLGTAEQN